MKNKLLMFFVLFINIIAVLTLNSCTKIFKIDHTTPNGTNDLIKPPLSIPPDLDSSSSDKKSPTT